MTSIQFMPLPIYGRDKSKILPYPLPSKEGPDGIFGKKKHKDGDLKVNKQEIADKIIAEYNETGKLPEGYDNTGDYIADQMEKFKKYDLNKDGKLNIDEYINMKRVDFLDIDYGK